MPKNIFSRVEEGAIFRDEKFLYPEFVPERLPFRDPQIDEMVHSFQPVLKGGKPQNLFVSGPSGTGKTVTVKYVLRELEEFSDRAKGLYLNCFEFNTRQAVLNKLCSFMGHPVPRRGIATDEVYNEFLTALKKSTFTPIVILDELDQLLPNGMASAILYDLLRVVEFQKSTLGVVIIANDPVLTTKLDSRVRSSLLHSPIEFVSYGPQQLKEILRERAKYAFLDNVIEPDVINLAAAHASKNSGDARLAIESLLRAGRIAERAGKETVSVEHLREAFDSIHSRVLDKAKDFLEPEEKEILKILSREPELTTGKLFEQFSKKNKLSDRTFRKKVNHLEQMNLIQITPLEKGVRGKTRLVKLAQSKEEIENVLK